MTDDPELVAQIARYDEEGPRVEELLARAWTGAADALEAARQLWPRYHDHFTASDAPEFDAVVGDLTRIWRTLDGLKSRYEH